MQRGLARLSSLLLLNNRDLIPSFSSTVTSSPTTAKDRAWSEIISPSDLTELKASLFAGKRVIFFGEQHQQSQVLRAQMKIIELLHKSSMSSSSNLVDTLSTHKSQRANKRVVIVMEHFNFLQTPMLDRFARNEMTVDDLVREYKENSNEGFRIDLYIPILLLARELGISVRGGFPPREWASVVYKHSIGALKAHETYGPLVPHDFDEARWAQVARIGREQVMYLRSLLSGAPPTPLSSTSNEHEHEHDADVIKSNGTGTTTPDIDKGNKRERADDDDDGKDTFESGILPAQTLKDTFFAYAIDSALCDPDVVVLAIGGLGHTEYGINASARLMQCSRAEVLLVASKAWDATEWIGDGTEPASEMCDDVIVPYHSDPT